LLTGRIPGGPVFPKRSQLVHRATHLHSAGELPDCPSRFLRYFVHNQSHEANVMRSTTFTVRVDTGVKKRLERLAKSTGRSRSFLAAEAIHEYLEVNEWQVSGIRRAIASLDRGEGFRSK